MTFDSYHWYHALAGSTELERARRRMFARDDREAFELLLRSDDPVAVGVALDQFHHADAATRAGPSNPFAEYREEVRARAREVLRGAPSPGSLETEPGASHASALGALIHLAEPQDAALIVAALQQTRTSSLRLAAAAAAGTVLTRSEAPDPRLLEALGQIALDSAARHDERDAAVSALGRTRSAAATELLLRIIHVPDLGLQARAALRLLERDPRAHRARIAELALMWPKDLPHPAGEVLEVLEGLDSSRAPIRYQAAERSSRNVFPGAGSFLSEQLRRRRG